MDIVLGIVIFGAAVFAARSIIKQKKNGKCMSCGGDCGSCPMAAHHKETR